MSKRIGYGSVLKFGTVCVFLSFNKVRRVTGPWPFCRGEDVNFFLKEKIGTTDKIITQLWYKATLRCSRSHLFNFTLFTSNSVHRYKFKNNKFSLIINKINKTELTLY